MVAYTSDAEVFEGVLRALDSHEFVFARLMALAVGGTCSPSPLLSVTTPNFRSGADSI
jgi:hypothetical protein